jgi:tRNA/rRNA methyltransferase/tRNA (cytidine32/uridine32-2'-O)-methyltransferase
MSPAATVPSLDVRFVLCDTSHPGNIGAVARAMKCMGLADLALVAPKDFPHPEATARAAGAEDLLARARVHATLDEALADRTLVVATSARRRTIPVPELAPRALAERLAGEAGTTRCAVLFGAERTGLTNPQLDRASHLCVIPGDPAYASLNLAAAAQIVAYELRVAALAGAAPPRAAAAEDDAPPADAAEVEAYYRRLEQVLARSGFLDEDNPRHLMRRLRRLYGRAGLDQNEVRILHGIVSALAGDGEGR